MNEKQYNMGPLSFPMFSPLSHSVCCIVPLMFSPVLLPLVTAPGLLPPLSSHLFLVFSCLSSCLSSGFSHSPATTPCLSHSQATSPNLPVALIWRPGQHLPAALSRQPGRHLPAAPSRRPGRHLPAAPSWCLFHVLSLLLGWRTD